jgi:hypothetical protein
MTKLIDLPPDQWSGGDEPPPKPPSELDEWIADIKILADIGRRLVVIGFIIWAIASWADEHQVPLPFSPEVGKWVASFASIMLAQWLVRTSGWLD